MHPPVSRRRPWRWGAVFVAVAAIAQACGGGSQTTGPSGATQVTLTLTGLETALLPANCPAVLSVTGPRMAPVTASFPESGVLSLTVPAGPARVFAVTLRCTKTTGLRSFTGQQVADVIAGQVLNLAIHLAVNEPPTASASCSPSSVATGVATNCGCTASDPDPGDTLLITWSSTGGNLSAIFGSATQFQSSTPGAFTLTCTVSDGKASTSATTTVSVGAQSGTVSVTTAGTGSGTVTSAPAGITCPGTCTATYSGGIVVTLTATPAAGSVFAGWTGACSGTGSCVVTANGSVAVVAIFNVAPPPTLVTLTVTKPGPGSGTVTSNPPGINCGPSCVIFSAKFASGTVVTLTATPGGSSVFAGWSGGGCSGTGSCSITLIADTAVTATFN